jgi:hypothetical protein
MFDLQVISIIAGVITVSSLFYWLYRSSVRAINRIQTRIEAVETSLKTAKSGKIIEDCYGVVNESKVISLKAGEEFILGRVNESGMAIGRVFHNEVEVMVDLRNLSLDE